MTTSSKVIISSPIQMTLIVKFEDGGSMRLGLVNNKSTFNCFPNIDQILMQKIVTFSTTLANTDESNEERFRRIATYFEKFSSAYELSTNL